MTDKDDKHSDPAPDNSTTDVTLEYASPSSLRAADGAAELSLFGNIKRDPVEFQGRIKQPLRLREALAAVYTVVGSDFRYVPKDRTAHLAYQRLRRESSNLNSWQAQQAYFSWLLRNDPLAFIILDPVITVHPDAVLFEVFSKDEGTYVNLSVSPDAFEVEAKSKHGTTNIDFSETLLRGILRMRSHRETRLSIAQEQVEVRTEDQPESLEKQIKVPDSWLRGFLQVQSAATLPSDDFSLSPMDFYNILRHLRMNGDRKGKRRGLRIELVPGEPPNIVLEPWETVVTSSAGVYQGRQAKVVRVWGRRRLMMLRRLLPFINKIDVRVLGSGLPSFWILRGDEMTVTVGLTGFTAANWAQSAAFDLLLPRQTQGSTELEKVVKHLSKKWHADAKELEKATKLKAAELLEAVQLGCQQGQLMVDVATGGYRLRPLTGVPLNLEKLEYRNQNERQAHDLLSRKAAVSIARENRIFGTGVEITGKVEVAEDKRDYRPQLLINDEGFVTKAECTCTAFRTGGLTAGPCTHLIALRLAFAQLEMRRKESSRSRKQITMETRTYSKRKPAGEEVFQLTLDRKRVQIRWGDAGQDLRLQQLRFNSVDDARQVYLDRVEELTKKGYLDASA